jgi:hypothetical protein
MSELNRNDPCSCGSGKKYKRCCLISNEESDFQFRQFRQTHAGLIRRLTQFAFERLPLELVDEAWKDFNDHQAVEEFDPESPMNVLFMPWFLFNWIVELQPVGNSEFRETTIAEQFLVDNLHHITSDERSLLLSSIRCPYTLCEVTEVKPEIGMTLFDLLRRIKFEVVERSASQSLKRGEIIYCATSEVAGFRSNVGTGPYALRPTAKRDVVELRKWILGEIGIKKIKTEHLYEFEYDIRGLYLDAVRRMLAPPALANTDGDLWVPHKLYFDLRSADQAFKSLKDLAEGYSDAELMRDAVIKKGLIVKASIPWLSSKEEDRQRIGGPVLLGLLEIEEDRLVVEVNSKRRADVIRKVVEERIGDLATYKTTLIEPIDASLEEMWQAAIGNSSVASEAVPQDESETLAEAGTSLELRDALKEIARQHWEAWFDLPVPALNSMTPRQAAKTRAGRELLESLLLDYERFQDGASPDPFAADIDKLRKELGLGSR